MNASTIQRWRVALLGVAISMMVVAARADLAETSVVASVETLSSASGGIDAISSGETYECSDLSPGGAVATIYFDGECWAAECATECSSITYDFVPFGIFCGPNQGDTVVDPYDCS